VNQATQTLSPAAFLSSARAAPRRTGGHNLWQKLELTGLAVLLVVLNWSLLQGVCNTRLMFMPEAVRQGEWWRWFTHPFIHVTWWHLLLDGAAFLLLYRDLQEDAWVRRVLFCIGSAVGSLVVCFCADPMLSTNGLCGISAIAHGLMAVSALNLMGHREDKLLFQMGVCSFVVVTVKCLIEALTGKMLFAFLYFGMVGDPVAVTHAGGLLGALATWLLCKGRQSVISDRS
jgi:rhomboid family GlyGly-CTERM serine protease